MIDDVTPRRQPGTPGAQPAKKQVLPNLRAPAWLDFKPLPTRIQGRPILPTAPPAVLQRPIDFLRPQPRKPGAVPQPLRPVVPMPKPVQSRPQPASTPKPTPTPPSYAVQPPIPPLPARTATPQPSPKTQRVHTSRVAQAKPWIGYPAIFIITIIFALLSSNVSVGQWLAAAVGVLMLLFKLDSKYHFIVAICLLVLVPLFTAVHRPGLADNYAVYCYFFLVFGVLAAMRELITSKTPAES